MIVLLGLFSAAQLYSQTPKREMRAAWIATVTNLDWPYTGVPSQQQADLAAMLDDLKEIGINAVVFQIRPECDAFYDSPYEPWSYWLTGTQGKAPDPYYDPLEFAVREAHRRGMEIHAWFNPYRAERSVGSYTLSPKHVIKQHPDWILDFGSLKMLDPGLPMVREFVTAVVLDVVNRYDVDGAHFDDYFYPYTPTITTEDASTFANYSRGISNIGDWRRDNVNLLVQMIYDSIQVVKPWVKFGISPFGIWKNGVPSGIIGLDAYSQIFCDATAWLNAGTVDYLTPQLYWPFGGGQDYAKLLPWWASQLHGQHLYPGQGAYRISTWSDPSEMPNMIKLNRQTEGVYGSVYFRTNMGLLDNPRGFADTLKNNYYHFKALIPQMDWKDGIDPNAPDNLRYEPITGGGPAVLRWDLPAQAADGDTASRYVIYRSDGLPIDTADPANIFDITGQRIYNAQAGGNTGGSVDFLVTALDRNHNESTVSNTISVTAPEAPLLATPADGALDQSDTVTVSWHHSSLYTAYRLQVASDPQFSNLLVDASGISDSFYVVTDMAGQQAYYWRAKTSNAAGSSSFSQAFSFTTGFPVVPVLAGPPGGATNIPLDTMLTWHMTDQADGYQIQFARSALFNDLYIVIDTVLYDAQDTTLMVNHLNPNTRYYWHVRAFNVLGSSDWSETWALRTLNVSALEDLVSTSLNYELGQNYPNPFNPVSMIPYSISKPGLVSIRVYDILGREVATLVNRYLPAGRYEVQFDASRLPSGVYIYQLLTGQFRANKKLMVLK